jgi:hypothetical protein
MPLRAEGQSAAILWCKFVASSRVSPRVSPGKTQPLAFTSALQPPALVFNVCATIYVFLLSVLNRAGEGALGWLFLTLNLVTAALCAIFQFVSASSAAN